MNSEDTDRKRSDSFVLTLVTGKDSGKEHRIGTNVDCYLGRGPECEIRIDESELTVSRRHVLLKVEPDGLSIANLSRTNGIYVNGIPIDATIITDQGLIQAGSIVMEVKRELRKNPPEIKEKAKSVSLFDRLSAFWKNWREGKRENRKKTASKRRKIPWWVYAGVFFSTVSIVAMVKSGVRESAAPRAGHVPMEAGSGEGNPATSGTPGQIQNIPESGEKNGRFHIRNGIFFYETGKLKKAVFEFRRALNADPESDAAERWLKKSLEKLDARMNHFFQAAMKDKKYLRFQEARQKFEIVMKLSLTGSDQRYQAAVKALKELNGYRKEETNGKKTSG